MTQKEFEKVQNDLLQTCVETLNSKAIEYAKDGGDRLHNFKQAAHLKGETPLKSLFGMWSKHMVSIADMCMSDVEHNLDIWEEKLKDNINYSILAMALIQESKDIVVYEEEPSLLQKVINANIRLDSDVMQAITLNPDEPSKHHGVFDTIDDIMATKP